MSEPATPYRPRCVNLSCKSMMVYGEAFESDPDWQGGVVDFTCTCTFKGYGPDGGALSLELCSDPERSCFREY